MYLTFAVIDIRAITQFDCRDESNQKIIMTLETTIKTAKENLLGCLTKLAGKPSVIDDSSDVDPHIQEDTDPTSRQPRCRLCRLDELFCRDNAV